MDSRTLVARASILIKGVFLYLLYHIGAYAWIRVTFPPVEDALAQILPAIIFVLVLVGEPPLISWWRKRKQKINQESWAHMRNLFWLFFFGYIALVSIFHVILPSMGVLIWLLPIVPFAFVLIGERSQLRKQNQEAQRDQALRKALDDALYRDKIARRTQKRAQEKAEREQKLAAQRAMKQARREAKARAAREAQKAQTLHTAQKEVHTMYAVQEEVRAKPTEHAQTAHKVTHNTNPLQHDQSQSERKYEPETPDEPLQLSMPEKAEPKPAPQPVDLSRPISRRVKYIPRRTYELPKDQKPQPFTGIRKYAADEDNGNYEEIEEIEVISDIRSSPFVTKHKKNVVTLRNLR